VSLCLAVVLAATPCAATQNASVQQQNMDARLVRVVQWLKAVVQHEPGAADDAVALVGSWTPSQVQTLWLDTNVIVQLMRNPGQVSFSVRSEGQRSAQSIPYSPMQLRKMKGLACAAAGIVLTDRRCVEMKVANELDLELRRLAERVEAARRHGDENFILRRGALLHADVAMFIPSVVEPVGSTTAPGPQRVRMQTADGLGLDVGQVATHWELARMLLDHVKPPGADRPAPGRDPMVRLWYRATAMWMQSREDHDTNHLDRARAIFPDDPDILFLSACQHETYASPQIQSAVRSAVMPTGVHIAVGTDRAELRQAETLFRRALAANPSMPEAQLRLGRALSLLDRHADAAAVLREAIAATDEALLRYYGQLFLGAAEEALGQLDSAAAAYSAAEALYPAAQSPRIALSALARRRGDRSVALREMQQLFDVPFEPEDNADPWWTYHLAQTRTVDDVLEQLRRPFRVPVDR